ncbi:MAG: putative protein N(5)-glutamine methyltransferase [Jatrophihabitans sp.]
MDVEEVVRQLRSAGCVFAEDEAALLVAAATGDDLSALVARRVAGEPLEPLLGWAEFCGLRVIVDAGVFVPRRRTALLVHCALPLLPRPGVFVDLCCGSGAVALAVRTARPDLEVHAADLDPVQVRCARRNLGSATVHGGDLFAALPTGLRGRINVITANAPYVPSTEIALMPTEARDHEPRSALDGGPDGVDLHRRIAAGARYWLVPGGQLLIETSRRQAALTRAALEVTGFDVRIERDEDLDGTVAVGTVR